jgi:hypothetical protein
VNAIEISTFRSFREVLQIVDFKVATLLSAPDFAANHEETRRALGLLTIAVIETLEILTPKEFQS